MRIKIIEGALESLELLLLLRADKYSTSGIILDNFKKIKKGTVYSRLETLIKQGLIEKSNKKLSGKKIKPGGDKIEYKLTINGLTERKRLILKSLNILKPFTYENTEDRNEQALTDKLIDLSEELDNYFLELIEDIFNQELSIESIPKEFLYRKKSELIQMIKRLFNLELKKLNM
ncbi:MAG: hypothetical protein ACTSR8_00945 [Promethearchaeota archaeon]